MTSPKETSDALITNHKEMEIKEFIMGAPEWFSQLRFS